MILKHKTIILNLCFNYKNNYYFSKNYKTINKDIKLR